MAENSDKLRVKLHIYDTDLQVNINRKDEPQYREAAIMITETINRYAQVYKGLKSDKEMFFMAMVDIALRYEREKLRNDTSPYTDILEALTGEVEAALNQK